MNPPGHCIQRSNHQNKRYIFVQKHVHPLMRRGANAEFPNHQQNGKHEPKQGYSEVILMPDFGKQNRSQRDGQQNTNKR